jgi:uncharacterized Ntn-hydrolase superfamily protein
MNRRYNQQFILHWLLLLLIGYAKPLQAQDTFSIVAVDSVTGEVGSAGASCVDLFLFFPNSPVDFLGDLIPGQAAINTQASYNATNQNNARQRILAGDTPQQAINWLTANDVNNTPNVRQYGIAALVNGAPQTAGYSGSGTLNYKNHIAGPNYSIQGNILSGQAILDSMEARFLAEPGDLACKLMAALQGAKVPGADTRCATNGSGTSSLFAFLKVAQSTDSIGQPSLIVSVKTPGGFGIEPIDSLQKLFNAQKSCAVATVAEVSDVNWNIVPNPATEYVSIEWTSGRLPQNKFRCRIMDIAGKMVSEGNITVANSRIYVGNLPAGIYHLEISAEGQRYHQQFVKQ